MFESPVCSLWYAWNCVVCLGRVFFPGWFRFLLRGGSPVGQICSFRLVCFGTRFSFAIPLQAPDLPLCFGVLFPALVPPPWSLFVCFTASPSGSFFFILCCGSSCCTVFHRSITRRSSCSLSQRNDSFAPSLCLIAHSFCLSFHHTASPSVWALEVFYEWKRLSCSSLPSRVRCELFLQRLASCC